MPTEDLATDAGEAPHQSVVASSSFLTLKALDRLGWTDFFDVVESPNDEPEPTDQVFRRLLRRIREHPSAVLGFGDEREDFSALRNLGGDAIPASKFEATKKFLSLGVGDQATEVLAQSSYTVYEGGDVICNASIETVEELRKGKREFGLFAEDGARSEVLSYGSPVPPEEAVR